EGTNSAGAPVRWECDLRAPVRGLQCGAGSRRMVRLLFVALALACGAALTRAARLPLNVAPLTRLVAIAVLATWCAALRAPPLLSSGLIVICALCGVACLLTS